MKIINLRLHYPHCQQDKLVEVSEEVFDVLCQSVREMRNHERRKRYHRAYYSLDAYEWTENYALEHSPSPEQLVMLAAERAERDRLAAALREALAYATPTQARRICAYYLSGLTQQETRSSTMTLWQDHRPVGIRVQRMPSPLSSIS